MKIVLIGAGSAQFGFGTMGDIFQSAALEGAEICLMDINTKSLKKVEEIGKKFIEDRGLNYRLSATTDREQALKGADHVIISIEVGDRFELWDQDWNYPLQYGLNQIYGENGGPGGLFHSLRIIPPILDICGDIDAHAPGATVFCYSNPMTAITTAVLRKYPNMKFIGMCHEIASLQRYLPTILGKNFDELELKAGGLNHFSVLVEARYRDGSDAYPDILSKAPDYFSRAMGYSDIWDYAQRTGHAPETEGATRQPIIDRDEPSRAWSDRGVFREILERYSLLPITVDSHIGEYIPWARDVADHQGIRDFYEFYRRALASADRAEIDTSSLHERVVPMIEALSGLAPAYEEMAVNIMNNGLIPSLPGDVAVEVPGHISAEGVKGVGFADYPRGFAALLRNYTGVYDLIAEAVLHKNRNLAIQALLAMPSTSAVKELDALMDHMVDAQRPWLDYLK